MIEYSRSNFQELLAKDGSGNIIWVDGRTAPYSGCWDGEYLDDIRGTHEYTITEYDLDTMEKRKYKVILDATTKLDSNDLHRMTQFVDTEDITSHFTITDGVLYHYIGLDKDLVIPDTVTEIAEGAFENQQYFNSITIPKSLINISTDVFKHCRTNNIYVSEGNCKYYSKNGCLIDKTTGTLIWGAHGCVIPDDGSIKKIGVYAFRGCTDIKYVTIPNSVTEIETGAFTGCYWLEEINMPDIFADTAVDIFGEEIVKKGNTWRFANENNHFRGFLF
jgi:hypothetical protein